MILSRVSCCCSKSFYPRWPLIPGCGTLFLQESIRIRIIRLPLSGVTMQKTLDQKLAAIHADPSGCREFIIADAKDADMAFGIGAPGLSPERHDGELRFKTLGDYRNQIREITQQGIVDIMLMSASTSDVLAVQERVFENSHVTPAIRANDTTDIHVFRGSRVGQAASRPFRSASLDHAQCGYIDCEPGDRSLGSSLGLYSITFNNDRDLDLDSLNAYKAFRDEAERKGFRHFLEIFNPNLPNAVPPEQLPGFINDVIVRTLAGVTSAQRPVFLKMAYQGPQAMEDLVRYDPHLVVGILGGAAGTTLDAFQLLHEAQKYGAKAALFGRKINQAENQLAFVEFLRLVADRVLEPVEAVKAYHSVLERLRVKPQRPLDEDLTLQTNVMSYGVSGRTVSAPAPSQPARTPVTSKPAPSANPNFAKMTSEERLAYHRERLKQTLGD